MCKQTFMHCLYSFITTRKRSLQRLCFYSCLSFCPQGGCLADTPPIDPGQTPPRQIHPPGQTLQAHPPGQTPPLADPPPVQQMATAVDGTHPTSMHSCSDCNKKNKGHGIKMLHVDRPLCIVYIHSLPPANEVCEGYVLHLSVILSMGGMSASVHAGIPPRTRTTVQCPAGATIILISKSPFTLSESERENEKDQRISETD